MLAKTMLNANTGIEFTQTPFGICMIFYRDGKRIASYACEPNLNNSFCRENENYERDLTLEEVIAKLKA